MKICSSCLVEKECDCFSKKQWRNKSAVRRCKECITAAGDDDPNNNNNIASMFVQEPTIVQHQPKKLELALEKLKKAGGVEDPDAEENEDNETDPQNYLDELLAVGDARFSLGQYEKAAGIYYTSYYIAMHKGGHINNAQSFPVAHKMLQAYSKCDNEHSLQMGHGMAQQTLMMPGCPRYILQDKIDIEKAMRRKGIAIEDLMETLTRNMASMGMGF